ncbi:MAG: D-alanine--D-alanine ligase [Ruminococcaceae bacterium]|nr:D-alanine--D-alanine ligase [Oscillospiraceae bacterium]
MKTRVAVFFGGKSTEHEISIISAVQAMASFDREKYEVVPIYITKENEMYTGFGFDSIESYRDIPLLLRRGMRVTLEKKGGKVAVVRSPRKLFGSVLFDNIDVAFPIVHGTNVEDGTIAGWIEMLGLPYVGCDVLASAVGMDKYVMKAILKDNSIPVLDCRCFSRFEFDKNPDGVISRIVSAFAYPVIVKPINLGSSIGIKKASDEQELLDALELAFTFSTRALVEPAVVELREINCAVLGDSESAEASECEEPVSADEILSFEEKYMGGAKKTGSKGMASLSRKLPADIDSTQREKIRELAVKAFKVLGCNGVARIDFLLDGSNGHIYINEINTIPGSLSFYLWEPLGIKYPQLIDKLISLALKRQREKASLMFSFESNVISAAKLGTKGSKGAKL